MITEDDLRELLADAAQAAPPPGPAPGALLAAIAQEQATPTFGRRRRDWRPRSLSGLVPVAAVLLVALLTIGFLAYDPDGEGGPEVTSDLAAPIGPGASTTVPQPTSGRDESAGSDAEAEDGSVTYGNSAGEFSSASGAGGAGGSVNQPGQAPSDVAAGGSAAQVDSTRVVRTGAIHLEVEEGTFERTTERITTTVIGLGGYVADAQTGRDGDVPTGSIVVRVPSDAYEQLAGEVRSLGEVAGETTKATEVTAQFTDLQARLAAQVATRDRLSAVLAEAQTVSDILTVQDRITVVQTEIERLQGELRVLEDQTAMATLAVTVAEPGADPPELRSSADDGRDLGGAWDDARRRFGNGIEGVVAWSGVFALLALAALAAVVAVRVVWPRLRRFLL